MHGTAIKSITAKALIRSHKAYSVHVTVITENGAVGKGTCCPGISAGSYEVNLCMMYMKDLEAMALERQQIT